MTLHKAFLASLLLCPALASAQPTPPRPPTGGVPQVPAEPPVVAPPPVEAPVLPTPVMQPPPPTTPPAPSEQELEALQDYTPYSVKVGGYIQSQFRMRQNSPQASDEDGFRFARARLQVLASTVVGHLDISSKYEIELQPTFVLLDAFATIARKLPNAGKVSLDVGQMRTPISRQQLYNDSNTSFVDKAQLASIAADRDFGARLTFEPPKVPHVKIIAGSFNGEGKNQVQNINESFLHAARVELTPIGKADPLVDSVFGGTFLTLGFSVGYNKLSKGDTREILGYRGVDLSGQWQGLSGSVEYLAVKHTFEGSDAASLTPEFQANGWSAQLAYALPFKLAPFRRGRVEVAMRVEEIDRNDKFPIPAPGDPNQSVTETTAVVSYYLKQHALKLQLAFNHFDEKEDKTVTGGDATYDNDQAVLQLTYRLE
ncbi:MAG: porin [Proteobacteria bacterium]|nr:porin [Pseudomonadota bacterium]